MKIVEVKFKMRIDEDHESLEEYKRDIRKVVEDSIYDSIVFEQCKKSTYTTGPYDWSIEEICADENDHERFHEYIDRYRYRLSIPDEKIKEAYKGIFNYYKYKDQSENHTMMFTIGSLISSDSLLTEEDCDESIREFNIMKEALEESDLDKEQKDFWKEHIENGLNICNRDKEYIHNEELQRCEGHIRYDT